MLQQGKIKEKRLIFLKKMRENSINIFDMVLNQQREFTG